MILHGSSNARYDACAVDVVVHRVVRSENPRDVNYLLISMDLMYIPIYPSTSDESCTSIQFLSNLYHTPPSGTRAEPRYLLSRETKST